MAKEIQRPVRESVTPAKLINIRMKGSEKSFRQETGETLLQLRADLLCESHPLDTFWPRWRKTQTGSNTDRKQSA